MKYFSISPTNDLEVIGHYPQTDFSDNYNPTLPESHWQVKFNEFPDFKPNYKLDIHPKAIPTNLISGTGGYLGLLIDFELKQLLEQHNLPQCHFYRIDVQHNNKLLNYYWLHYVMDDVWKNIELESSEIRIQHLSNSNNYVVLPMINKDYMTHLHNYFLNNHEFHIIPEKIILKNKIKELDIIDLSFLHSKPLISYRLKKAIEEQGMNGYGLKLFKPIR